MPGAWMRSEERKNGSTKGREENSGLVAAQTRSIRPLPPTSPPPPLPRRARGRTERGTWFLRECTDTQRNLPVFFPPELACLSFSFFRSPSPAFWPHSSPIFFHPSLSTIRHFERERAPIPLQWVDFLTMTLARTYYLS